MNGQLKGIKLWIGMALLAGSIWTSAAFGSVFASGSTASPPANDNFASPVVLPTGLTASRVGDTNVDATLEAGEDPNVAERPASHTIWYSWTPAQRGQVTIDTTTSDFDTLLGVYTGTVVSALTEVASNDDNGGEKTSSVTFNVTAATTYRIRVDGFEGAMGTVNLHLNEILPPANDDFSTAIDLGVAPATRTGDTNLAATLEVGEDTTVHGEPGGASVWYRWTPATTGPVVIDTVASDFDTLLGVYTGSSVGALAPIASNDDRECDVASEDVSSAVSFTATAFTVYRIRVDGFGGNHGTIKLHLALGTATVPCAPINVTATEGAGQATVSWGEPGSGGSAITGYDVTRYVGGVAQGTTSVGAVTGTTVGGLTNGTTYTFRVVAKNAAGTGPLSSVSNAVTPRTVPDAPTGVIAAAGAGQATVSWAAPGFNGGSAITGYEVTRYLSGVAQGTTSVAGPVTQTTVSGLTNGATWTFKVAAVNIAGAGLLSAASNPVTPMTAPDAPTSVTASATAGQATVSWAAPAFNGGGAVTGYDVTRYVGGVAQGTTAVGVVTQTTVTGLANGTAYTFAVAAKNAVGAGALSAISNTVVPRTVPSAPTGVTATAGNGQATVNWTPPASDGGDTIGSYEVTSYAGGVAQATTPVAGTQAIVAGLTNGTTYMFRVTARNGVGAGAQSADSNAVTPVAPVAQRFTLAVSKSGTGAGIVTSSAGGITCGTSCAADFDAGTSLTLTAVAAAGSTFTGWSGACSGTGPCLVTIDAAKTATAAFSLLQLQQAPQPKVVCTVPNVTRKTLASAKKKIVAGHCRTGTVTRAKSSTVQKGRVISQKPKAGRKLARGAKVNLVLSRGKS